MNQIWSSVFNNLYRKHFEQDQDEERDYEKLSKAFNDLVDRYAHEGEGEDGEGESDNERYNWI